MSHGTPKRKERLSGRLAELFEKSWERNKEGYMFLASLDGPRKPEVSHGTPEEEDDDYGERWTDLLGYVHELRSEPCEELPEEHGESA